MRRSIAGIGFSILLSAPGWCQQNANRPAFEAADVRVSPRSDWVKSPTHTMQGGFLMGDRYELRRATMLDLIRAAYSVDADKVFGGPSWLDYDRFEITAKTKPGVRPETLRLMLQTLLEDRFRLVVKTDTREVPGYVLVKGKRELGLRAVSNAVGAGNCQATVKIEGDVPRSSTQCRNMTMEAFAPTLRRFVGNAPVMNSTGLEGGYDFDFSYAMAARGGTSANDSPLEALDALGLKLERGKVPQPVLVVESVTQRPSPNPPGVAESLPPLPPPQFEVASIKWPCNDNMSRAPRFETGGRLTATCMPLMSLIKQAWGLAPFQDPVGAPKWLTDGTTSHNISIAAKAQAGIAPDPQNNVQARDTINAMLRALLLERYQMKVHFEDRPMDAFTLVAVKPKLAKADPSGRTGCTRQNQQDQGRALVVKLVCLNMTMAQFAEQIQAYDSDIFYPVLDGTSLEGAWDFTLNYDAMANLNARFGQLGIAGGAPAGADAAEPTGALSLASAIEKQLGLKLEMHKRPVPVLVIDHIEEKPTDN